MKRSGDSDEVEDGLPSDEIIDKYIQSIMVMYLAHRPASAASPETLGLFETCYPQLDKIKLPKAVEDFNDLLDNPANQITEEDWRNLMQVYLDYTVRSNQSFYLRIPGNDKIDIFSTVRLLQRSLAVVHLTNLNWKKARYQLPVLCVISVR